MDIRRSTSVSIAGDRKYKKTRNFRTRKLAKRWLGGLATTVAGVLAIIWLVPFLLVVLTALQKFGLPSINPVDWFDQVTWTNFARAWDQAELGRYVINSAILSFVKVPLGLLISALCAFGISRFRFMFRGWVLIVLIGLLAVPVQIALISLFRMELSVGLLDTFPGVILAYLAFGIPFEVIFLVAYFNQVPIEIEESARIDGAGPWRYFMSILIPLSKPLLAALFLLDFVATWNEFPIALTLLQTSTNWTVPLGLLSFQGPFSTDYPLLSAAIVIAALPVIAVFVGLQKYFVSGLTSGAIKG